MKRITINTENLISALFILGFEQIDSFFLTAIMANLSINSRKNKFYQIILEDEHYDCILDFKQDTELSKPFFKFVDVNFMTKLKDGINMDSDVAKVIELNNVNYSFRQYISSLNNRLLAKYIEQNIDLSKIVIEKISVYGKDNVMYFKDIFSDKEKSMLLEIFGINDMIRKDIIQSQEMHKRLYNQESNDIDNAINTLNRLVK